MAEEKRFEQKIKNFLKSQNCYYVKYFGCGFSRAGVPDILACVNGHFLAIEVKAERGRVSELQRINIEHINNCGGVALVVKPSNFEELKQIIFKLKKWGIINEI